MTLSISGAVSTQPADTPASAPAATTQAPPPPPPTDTVTLSEPAQVSQLSLQGQSPSEIAVSLGIPVATVDSDLGIVATAVATAGATTSGVTTAPVQATAATAAATTSAKSASAA
jgi:hypothetical protein